MALEKKMEREYLAAQALVEQAQGQATQAVQVGKDDIARKSLARENRASQARRHAQEPIWRRSPRQWPRSGHN